MNRKDHVRSARNVSRRSLAMAYIVGGYVSPPLPCSLLEFRSSIGTLPPSPGSSCLIPRAIKRRCPQPAWCNDHLPSASPPLYTISSSCMCRGVGALRRCAGRGTDDTYDAGASEFPRSFHDVDIFERARRPSHAAKRRELSDPKIILLDQYEDLVDAIQDDSTARTRGLGVGRTVRRMQRSDVDRVVALALEEYCKDDTAGQATMGIFNELITGLWDAACESVHAEDEISGAGAALFMAR